ncbi:MAG: CPBP family intramembrane metalloprotease [Candidatus Marinimicrobia bacterium]|nr:CPBP family intramembrane metalloprotease [Candidatus Neomarinimicrobiota bacterium]
MKLRQIPNFATIFHATGLTILLLIIATIGGVILLLLDIDPIENPAVLFLNIPIFAITIFIGVKLFGVKFKMIAPTMSVSPLLLFWICIMALGTIILISDIANLVYYFFPPDPEILEIFEMIGTTSYGLIAAGLIAPITEELFFRGFLISGLLKNYSGLLAILISSILFGMIHENVWQTIPAIFMGLFLGWIFVVTRNIWVCVGIHSVQNLLFSTLDAAQIQITGLIYPIDQGVQFQPLWLDLTGALLFLIGLHFIRIIEKTSDGKT